MSEPNKRAGPDGANPSRDQDSGLDWATIEAGQGLSRRKRQQIRARSKRSARGHLSRATLPVRRTVRGTPGRPVTPLYLSGLKKSRRSESARWQPDPEHDELNGYVVTENRFDDYLEPTSPGTIAHKKLWGEQTQFNGCQELEEWLIENGLVRHDEFEGLGNVDKILKALSSKGKVIEQPFCFPRPEEILFDEAASGRGPIPISDTSFFYRFATDNETRVSALRNFTSSSWNPLAELIAPGANDLKEAHLRDLFHAGHWESHVAWVKDRPVEETVDPKLRVAAFLAVRGLTSKEQLERVYPFMEHKDFERYLSKIYATVEKTLPTLFRRFVKFWDGLDLAGQQLPYEDRLTERQKEVITLIYFKNMSQADVARRDGNAESTISEHVDKATDKLRKCFGLPLLMESRPYLPDGRTYFAALMQEPDSTYDGFYRRSSNKPGEIYAVDPATGTRTGRWIRPALPHSERDRLVSRRVARDWPEWRRPKYRTVPRPPDAPAGLKRQSLDRSGQAYPEPLSLVATLP